MIQWRDVVDSDRIVAAAYDEQQQIIYVRFKKDGVEWWYADCSALDWEGFMAPGQSKGRFIKERLDAHRHGPLAT